MTGPRLAFGRRWRPVDEELQTAPGWVVDEHDAPEETRGSRAGRVEAP